MTNPFSTTGARQFGAAPLWGASAADALQPPLRLTVMTGALFGAARASVEVEIARSATVGELLRRVMALAQLLLLVHVNAQQKGPEIAQRGARAAPGDGQE